MSYEGNTTTADIQGKEDIFLMEAGSGNKSTTPTNNMDIQSVIGPLIHELQQEFKLLWETVDNKCINLESAIESQRSEVSCEIGKMEKSLITHKQELSNKLDITINSSNKKMDQITDENRKLRNENNKLLQRIQKIESQQLSNNFIISGITEGPWENYDTTVQ